MTSDLQVQAVEDGGFIRPPEPNKITVSYKTRKVVDGQEVIETRHDEYLLDERIPDAVVLKDDPSVINVRTGSSVHHVEDISIEGSWTFQHHTEDAK